MYKNTNWKTMNLIVFDTRQLYHSQNKNSKIQSPQKLNTSVYVINYIHRIKNKTTIQMINISSFNHCCSKPNTFSRKSSFTLRRSLSEFIFFAFMIFWIGFKYIGVDSFFCERLLLLVESFWMLCTQNVASFLFCY